jgi:hypothetical protein
LAIWLTYTMFRTVACWTNEHIPHLLALFPHIADSCVCTVFVGGTAETIDGRWTRLYNRASIHIVGFNSQESTIPTDGMQVLEIRLEYKDANYVVEIDMLGCKITQTIGTSRADYDNLVPLMEIRDAGFDINEYVVRHKE